jgi:hypothetical protein
VFWDIAGHFSTVIPFHPLGEPSSSIVFPNFLSSHMQGSAFLCDLCDSALKNETPTADSRLNRGWGFQPQAVVGESCLNLPNKPENRN